MNLKNLKITFIFALMSLAAVPMNGQDLLARQAPVDKKMKKVDSVALHQLIYQEMLENPAADLYDEWDTEMTHYHNANSVLPETAKIDLRGFVMPTPSRVITSNFGARWGRQHKGLDIKVYVGDTIRAAFSGKVRIVKYEAKGYGKYVVIRHYNGLETYYAHMSKQLVHEDQEVKAGDPIGLGGNTGRSTGSHLHFETRLCGVAINPALLFDFRAQDVTGDFYTYNRKKYASESAAATRLRGANAATHNSRFDTDEARNWAMDIPAGYVPAEDTLRLSDGEVEALTASMRARLPAKTKKARKVRSSMKSAFSSIPRSKASSTATRIASISHQGSRCSTTRSDSMKSAR